MKNWSELPTNSCMYTMWTYKGAAIDPVYSVATTATTR